MFENLDGILYEIRQNPYRVASVIEATLDRETLTRLEAAILPAPKTEEQLKAEALFRICSDADAAGKRDIKDAATAELIRVGAIADPAIQPNEEEPLP